MIARIIISPSIDTKTAAIEQILTDQGLKNPHPDVLYLDQEKLGVEQSKQIREFLSIKPYSAQGRVVIVLYADNLTLDAQNALLKTLEEPPENAILLLGAENESKFLPTVLSRCQVIHLAIDFGHFIGDESKRSHNDRYVKQIERLQQADIVERFQFIEKLEEREEFFQSLLVYFSEQLHQQTNTLSFMHDLLEAEKWQKANGNMRAILEYLMLRMKD